MTKFLHLKDALKVLEKDRCRLATLTRHDPADTEGKSFPPKRNVMFFKYFFKKKNRRMKRGTWNVEVDGGWECKVREGWENVGLAD